MHRHPTLAEIRRTIRHAVDELHALLRAGNPPEIIQQLQLVGVTGKRVDDLDFSPHHVAFAENADFPLPIADAAAQHVVRAVADEQDRGFRIADIVFQMVQNAARLAHAGGGNDDRHVGSQQRENHRIVCRLYVSPNPATLCP